MKTWIKRTLIGLFGAGVLFGGLAACSHGPRHGHGWQAMSEEDAAKMKSRIVNGMIRGWKESRGPIGFPDKSFNQQWKDKFRQDK